MPALIDELLARFPALRSRPHGPGGSLFPHVPIFINGRDARYLEQGLATPIRPRGYGQHLPSS